MRQQKALGALNGHVAEMYSGHTIVTAFGHEERSVATFNGLNETYYDGAWRAQFATGMMFPIMMFIGNLGYVAVAVIGGFLVILLAGAAALLLFIMGLELVRSGRSGRTRTAATQAAAQAGARRRTDLPGRHPPRPAPQPAPPSPAPPSRTPRRIPSGPPDPPPARSAPGSRRRGHREPVTPSSSAVRRRCAPAPPLPARRTRSAGHRCGAPARRPPGAAPPPLHGRSAGEGAEVGGPRTRRWSTTAAPTTTRRAGRRSREPRPAPSRAPLRSRAGSPFLPGGDGFRVDLDGREEGEQPAGSRHPAADPHHDRVALLDAG